MIVEFIFSTGFLVLIFGFFVSFCVIWLVREVFERKVGNRPPGPYGVPVLGYLPFATMTLHRKLISLQETYGPVMYLKLGKRRTLVLNDYDSIREGFAMPVYQGRAPTHLSQAMTVPGESCSIFFRDGDLGWKIARKAAVRAISLFASSKKSNLQDAVLAAADTLIERLKEHKGEAIEERNILVKCCSVIMNAICFGAEPDFDDPIVKLHAESMEVMQSPASGLLIFSDFLPIPRFFLKSIEAKFKEVIFRESKATRKMLDDYEYDGGEVRNVVEGVKKSIQELDEDSIKKAGLTRRQMEMVAGDVFGAGTADVPENLVWICVNLACRGEVQMKVREEVEAVLEGRAPLVGDAEQLSYLQAFILESLRWVSSAPFFPHTSMAHSTFRGFSIPPDTDILGNLWAANHDPKLYEEPMEFRPERYLNPDGKINSSLASKLLTFSTGTRRCPGEPLAKQVLFLVTARLLQEFDILLDPNTKGDPLEQQMAMGLVPSPHKLIFKSRT